MKNGLIIVDHQTAVPAAIAAAGAPARKRFVEFFTANIRNRNTRLAYARAVSDFFSWCEQAGLATLDSVQPVHHESPRTTKLYDRRNDVVSLDEVEKVVF